MNAFAILGRCVRAAKGTQINVQEFIKEAASANYENLMITVVKYFEVY